MTLVCSHYSHSPVQSSLSQYFQACQALAKGLGFANQSLGLGLELETVARDVTFVNGCL